MLKIGTLLPIFFVFMLAIPQASQGQKHEVGGGLGILNYTGELTQNLNPVHSRPAGMLFYRHNFSPVVAWRTSLMGGLMHSDEKKSKAPLSKFRQGNFSSTVAEVSSAFEYNFFNYRDHNMKYLERYSPYLTAGITAYYYQTNSTYVRDSISAPPTSASRNAFSIAIPIGLGIKYQINKQWNLGIEFVARRTFTDNLDGMSEHAYLTLNAPPPANLHFTNNPTDKDWYYFTGISLSYTFYSIMCPELHFR